MFQRCKDCNAALFQPMTVCRACGSRQLAWTVSEGQGTVYSWSTVWRPPTPSFQVPFVVAIVDVAEGYQMMANIIGCAVDSVRIGLPLVVEFHPIDDGFVLPYFRANEKSRPRRGRPGNRVPDIDDSAVPAEGDTT
jgi:uncharacterized protein